MQDTVQKRVAQLSCKYQAYLNNLKASLACISVAFFSILPIASAQVSLVESLPSRIEYPSVEAKLLFFLFICAVYATAAACPVLLGFHFFSGITVSALILLSTLTALILYVLDMAEFGGSIFFLFVGIVIGWFGEVAWALCIIFIYSFWRNKSYLIVLLICSLAIIFLADQLANIPPKSGFDVLLTTCLSSFFALFVSILIARKALQEVPPFAWLKDHAIALSAIGGISFNKLEIKNLSFEGVDLSHVDFRGSKIYRTSFRGARNLKL